MSDLQHFSIVSELLGITLISVVKGWQGAHPGAQGRQGATKMASEALRQGTFSEVVTFLVSFPCPGIWAMSRRIRPRQKEKKKSNNNFVWDAHAAASRPHATSQRI